MSTKAGRVALSTLSGVQAKGGENFFWGDIQQGASRYLEIGPSLVLLYGENCSLSKLFSSWINELREEQGQPVVFVIPELATAGRCFRESANLTPIVY
jgi:hypothetical protein